MMKDVFIIGSKGVPASYGGFETFVDNLVSHQKKETIRYHIACMEGSYHKDKVQKWIAPREFVYQNAQCFEIMVPPIGAAKAVFYDLAAFQYCISYIRKHKCKQPVVYILACRIGPFIHMMKKQLNGFGGKLFVNPDGHEWMRGKWNAVIKKYWKYSERLMVKYADLLVCDSVTIEKYIQKEYKKYHPDTTYIAYGTDADDLATAKKYRITESDIVLNGDTGGLIRDVRDWYAKYNLQPMQYYLIVGRFVPENNYEYIIRDFMSSTTRQKLVIISNVEKNAFYQLLRERTGFEQDERIIFAGTVYDSQLLKIIRANATAYLHGHEVGGTNPSLLEALASTQVNILLDVGFNREVAGKAAFYFKKEQGSLVECMKEVEDFTADEREKYERSAKQRIRAHYSHEKIVTAYEELFLK